LKSSIEEDSKKVETMVFNVTEKLSHVEDTTVVMDHVFGLIGKERDITNDSLMHIMDQNKKDLDKLYLEELSVEGKFGRGEVQEFPTLKEFLLNCDLVNKEQNHKIDSLTRIGER
jgi:hypothetical protein